MSMHTEGPWETRNGMVFSSRNKSGKTLAQVYGRTQDEEDANALLIAAAPDLLEACRLVLSLASGGYDRHMTPAIRAMLRESGIARAVAKAAGSEVRS